MQPRRHLLVPILCLPLLLAACGGATAAPTPALTPIPSPAAPDAPSTAPTPTGSLSPTANASSGTGSPAPSPSPVALHADPALEAMLPTLVEGQAVHVETVKVAEYLQLIDPASDASHELQRFLTETAADPAGITVAFGSWGAGDQEQIFQAYRAPGGRPDRLLAATVYLMRSATGDPAKATIATTRFGNRTVTTVTGEGEAPISISVFVEGELAVVTAAAPDQVAALLDALP